MNCGWGISYEIALRWMPLHLTDDKSTLVEVMTWWRKATSHYLRQFLPRSMLPNVVTRPKCVKAMHYALCRIRMNTYTMIILKLIFMDYVTCKLPTRFTSYHKHSKYTQWQIFPLWNHTRSYLKRTRVSTRIFIICLIEGTFDENIPLVYIICWSG